MVLAATGFVAGIAFADPGDALDTRGSGISERLRHPCQTCAGERPCHGGDRLQQPGGWSPRVCFRRLIELKQGDWDRAIADYTQSLYYRPELSTSLYGRALARRARGDTAGAASDFKASSASEPNITLVMTRLGVHVQQ